MRGAWLTRNPGGPAVHALVIGVSDYPLRPFGLQPLHSAAWSAARFARWLAGPDFRPPQASTGSIRLLVSPGDDAEQKRVRRELDGLGDAAPAPGTRLECANALEDWAADLERDDRNVAVLYAAGHGAQEGGRGGVVLLSDAGTNRGNPLDEALDVEQTLLNFRGPTAPQEQWYFVDACRQELPLADHLVRPLRGGVALRERRGVAARHARCYYAAANDGRAYEVPSREEGDRWSTVFGDCLHDALARAVQYPLPEPGRWVVVDSSLEAYLRENVRAQAARHDQDQTIGHAGDGVGETVLTVVDRPDVLLNLDVVPEAAAVTAVAGLRDGQSGLRPLSGVPLPVREAPVPAGHWILDIVQPAGARYGDMQEILHVWPPPPCERKVEYP